MRAPEVLIYLCQHHCRMMKIVILNAMQISFRAEVLRDEASSFPQSETDMLLSGRGCLRVCTLLVLQFPSASVPQLLEYPHSCWFLVFILCILLLLYVPVHSHVLIRHCKRAIYSRCDCASDCPFCSRGEEKFGIVHRGTLFSQTRLRATRSFLTHNRMCGSRKYVVFAPLNITLI